MKSLYIKIILKYYSLRCWFTSHEDDYFNENQQIVRCSKCGRIDMEWTYLRQRHRDTMKIVKRYFSN